MQRDNNGGMSVISEGNFRCDICDQTDLVPSQIELVAAYGSSHDGERVKLKICGDCIDWLLNTISERAGKLKISSVYKYI